MNALQAAWELERIEERLTEAEANERRATCPTCREKWGDAADLIREERKDLEWRLANTTLAAEVKP